MKAWKRVLNVKLTSQTLHKTISFGESKNTNLSIHCTVRKYMSSLKDTAIIKIQNLTYAEVVRLVSGNFFDIQIFAGYESANVNKIFDGGVLYISNQLNADRTNTVIILAASQLVAKYGQKRLKLTLNSGINLYSAINFICRRAGMPNSNVSTQFKKEFLEEVLTLNETAGSWLDILCSTNTSYITNSDSILEQTFSIFDANKSNSRVIKLDNNNISLVGGYPRLTSSGVQLNLLPSFNFMCGDVIQIDNSILDISTTDTNSAFVNYGSYFSEKGQYMIYEMTYDLSNRSASFNLNLHCKNRDRISSYIGG